MSFPKLRQLFEEFHQLRVDGAELECEDQVGGVEVTTEFYCHFGFRDRNSRHILKMGGQKVGLYEEFVPWSPFEDTGYQWILDVVLYETDGLDFETEENPYWEERPIYHPCLGTVGEAVRVAKMYFQHLKNEKTT